MMPDPAPGSPQDRIDRFARGELSAAESRELAQGSLDNAELFDELTSSALAKAALERRPKVIPLRRKTRSVVIVSAAAAVVAALSIYLLRPGSTRRESAPAVALTPALAHSAKSGQPVLLTELLQQEPGSAIFRGDESNGRSPRPAGSIVSVNRGVGVIDLGSLDGLTKGDELDIYKDAASTAGIGRITLTAVFRERARGRVSGDVRAGNTVRVAPAVHLNALLEQVSALNQRGDAEAAQKMAEQAARWADTTPAAAPSRRAAAWNVLAVFRLLRGDRDGAETQLRQARAAAPKSNPEWARAANNLGVLAEMRGDRRAAESFYRDALNAIRAAPDAPPSERQAINTNLTRVRASH
jgi:hypothetical protein